MMKKLKHVVARTFSEDEIPSNALDFLKCLESILDSVPNREDVSVKLEASDNYGNPEAELKVSYYREETPEEETERKKAELAREELNKNQRLKMYQELKKEFGD